MEFVSFIDTRKGKKLLKVFKSQRAANMFLKKNTDKILSKRDIESVGTMSKKEWDTKEAKYAIEGFSSDAQRKAAFANGYEEKDKKNEGKKRFKKIKESENKSINEGKYDGVLDKIEDLVSKAKSFMDVGNQLKKQKIKYSFSTSIMPIYRLDKLPIAIVNKRYAKPNTAAGDRVVGDMVIGLMESMKMNEAGKLAMGIAALTGTRGSAVQDFIDKNRINDKKLFKALKSANLQGRINFASALSGKPNNPNARLTKKLFGESKKEVIAFRKKAKSETAFYDILDKIERKYGRGVFEKWLDKSLKDLKLNPKKYKTSADKQEALYQAKL